MYSVERWLQYYMVWQSDNLGTSFENDILQSWTEIKHKVRKISHPEKLLKISHPEKLLNLTDTNESSP